MAPLPPPLNLTPVTQWIPAAGLRFLVFGAPEKIRHFPPVRTLSERAFAGEERKRFLERYGEIDPMAVHEAAVAGYESGAELVAARASFDPLVVDRAFLKRFPDATRTVHADPRVLSLSAARKVYSEQWTLFGESALVLERLAAGPRADFRLSRAATRAAQHDLPKRFIAVEASPLSTLVPVLDASGVCALFPGPFGDPLSGRGLLSRASAMGLSATLHAEPKSPISLRVVLDGVWSESARAASYMKAWLERIAESDLGRLLGLHHPRSPLAVVPKGSLLVADTTLDGDALARGLRDATVSSVDEILGGL